MERQEGPPWGALFEEKRTARSTKVAPSMLWSPFASQGEMVSVRLASFVHDLDALFQQLTDPIAMSACI